MSIKAKPWEGGGAASVPDASEAVKGIIRIATSAEATTGTDDTIAMTPLTVKERIDASLVGGVEYKGTFDATAGTPSLANAEKGDLYIIDTAGTIYGQDWNVGDHLLINENMGGSISNSKIDKIDNTDAVTQLNDLSDVTITGAATGEVLRYNGASWVDATLAYSDLSGTPTLATVATTGAYSDLSGTPTLATVATTGAYSDLSGTPTLGTAAALDVGTGASNVVQLDGSARLPAVDGSQLRNLPSGNQIVDVEIKAASSFTASSNYIYLCGYTSGTQTITFPAASSSNDGDLIALSSNNGSRSVSIVSSDGTTNDIVDVNNTAKGGTNGGLSLDIDRQLVWFSPSGTSWRQLNGALATVATTGAYSDLSGTPTLATVATTGAYSDLSGTPTLATVATTGAYSDLSGTPTLATVATTGAYSDLSGLPTLGTAAAADTGDFLASTAGLNDLSDVTISSVSNGQVISYNSTSGEWENSTPASGGGQPNLTVVSNTSYTLTAANAPNIYIWYGASNSSTFTVTMPAIADVISDIASVNGSPAETFEVHIGRGQGGDITVSATNGIDLLGDGSVTYSTTQTINAGEWIKLIGWKVSSSTARYLMNSPISGLTNLSDVTITSAASGNLLEHNGTAFVNVAKSTIDVGTFNDDGTYLKDVIDDTTPQLGGDLDVNANEIISASNNNVILRPNGTGVVQLGGNTNPAEVRLYCESGDAHYVGLKSPAHASLSGSQTWTLPTADGTTGQVIQTNGSGVLSFVDQSGGAGGGWTYSAITADPANAQAGYHYSCTGTFTITLPTSGVSAGEEIRVKNMGTGTITIDPQTQNIDGSTTDYVMDVQYSAITLVSTGTHWEVI
jgi:hypothetical protein